MQFRLTLFLAGTSFLFILGLSWVRESSRTFGVEDHKDLILKVAKERELDPALVAAMVYVESSGDPRAISSAKAVGLMQLRGPALEDAANYLRKPVPPQQLLFDPETNIRFGTAYLKVLERQFKGDLDLAILAYYQGPGNLNKKIRADGGRDKFKERLKMRTKGGGTEYLYKVRDFEHSFRERWALK